VFYIAAHIIPTLFYLLIDAKKTYGPYLLGSATIAQTFNAMSEIAQILQARGIKKYLSEDPWNIADLTQILSFFIFLYTEIA
jgi:hypothetical protein